MMQSVPVQVQIIQTEQLSEGPVIEPRNESGDQSVELRSRSFSSVSASASNPNDVPNLEMSCKLLLLDGGPKELDLTGNIADTPEVITNPLDSSQSTHSCTEESDTVPAHHAVNAPADDPQASGESAGVGNVMEINARNSETSRSTMVRLHVCTNAYLIASRINKLH
jgi:Tfp pilus assembly protein FimV